MTRDSRNKGFSNVAEVSGSLRRAVLKLQPVGASTSGGIRQQSLAIVGHFFRAEGGMALFVSPLSLSFNLSGFLPERFMEPNDDQPPSTGDTAWEFRR